MKTYSTVKNIKDEQLTLDAVRTIYLTGGAIVHHFPLPSEVEKEDEHYDKMYQNHLDFEVCLNDYCY